MEQATDLPRERPAGVPPDAAWIPEMDRWELASFGTAGTKEGEFTLWRSDGTLYMRGRYEAGQAAGPFSIYHPNGQLAREGRYAAGELDGEVNAYGSDAETPETLRGCCVPRGAWRMRARWNRGELLGETFYDREGRVLLSDGTPRPERPAGVPADAEYDEWSRRWAHGTREEGATNGRWRYWTDGGALDEEAEYRDGRKVHARWYDAAGALREEVHLAGEGVRHGPYLRRYLAAGESPWADARIVEERGAYEHGQAVGPWTFLDAGGQVLRTLDRGPAHRDEVLPGPLADEDVPPEGWRGRAETLRMQGRAREAILAAARAADADFLRAFLAETTQPLAPEANERVLAGLGEGEGLAAPLDALVGGADPAACLRVVASLVKGPSRAALDLAGAAILLAPERPMAYLTRALVRIERGDPEGARADADRVAAESPDTAQFVRDYVRVLFPAFTFWPAQETPSSELPDMPEAPLQPLAEVRRAIQVYATRMTRIRAALLRLTGPAPWLPPDLSTLLPDGPLDLRAFDAEIVDETEEGPETTAVSVDEALPADFEGWGAPALVRLARAQWMGLGWLCWASGLDRVALPTALTAPAAFQQAAGMAIARYWRAQDGVMTGGLRAMTAGVQGFTWEGMDLDGLPKLFAEMARDEYLEMRSVFLWLASPENLSPWQSDLRAA